MPEWTNSITDVDIYWQNTNMSLFHEASNSRWPQADPAAVAVPAAVPAPPVTVPPELEYVEQQVSWYWELQN